MTDQIFQLACDIRKITDELGWAKKMWEQHPWIYKNYLQLMKYGDNTKLRVLVNLRQFVNSYNQEKSSEEFLPVWQCIECGDAVTGKDSDASGCLNCHAHCRLEL